MRCHKFRSISPIPMVESHHNRAEAQGIGMVYAETIITPPYATVPNTLLQVVIVPETPLLPLPVVTAPAFVAAQNSGRAVAQISQPYQKPPPSPCPTVFSIGRTNR